MAASTSDAAYTRGNAKYDYRAVRKAEMQYATKLRKLARHVGELINGFPAGDLKASREITRLLAEYARSLTPWANAVAAGMLADVGKRDRRMWEQSSKHMAVALRNELLNAPTGVTYRELQAAQVKLITSIPTEAAARVHQLTFEGLATGARAAEIAQEIRRSGHVAESRANLIARTEVGRASTNLTQARAEYVGSQGYIWRTSEDEDVRRSHRKLEGTFHLWSTPPLCDPPGYYAHPGCIFNCRCWPEVVLPDEFRI